MGSGRGLAWLPLLVLAGALVAACAQAAIDMRSWAPSWVTWSCAQERLDLDGDGTPELLALARGRMQVRDAQSGACRYETPVGWAVSDAWCAEVDEEPGPDVVLVVWKRGSFGRHLPFWQERNDSRVSQHVFVFHYRDGGLVPVWMSSELAGGARRAWLDGQAHLHLVNAEGAETVWRWDYFGFKLVEGAADIEGGERSFTLVAVGDNLVHDSLYAQMRTEGSASFDFSPVYAHVADVVGAADVAAVVQETPLVIDPGAYGGYPSFGTPQAVGDALADAGFDIVCAATNHACDRGLRGVRETVAFWREEHPDVTLLGMHGDGLGSDVPESDGPERTDGTAAVDDLDSGGGEGGGTATGAEAVDGEAGDDATGAASGADAAGAPGAVDGEADGTAKGAATSAGAVGAPGVGQAESGSPKSSEGARVQELHRAASIRLVNGVRVALLDYTYGLNAGEPPDGQGVAIDLIGDGAEAVRQLEQAEHAADVSICFLHMGEEYARGPDEAQRALVERLVDAGADVVICSHPHVVWPMERLVTAAGNEAVVYWSLGNFASHQTQLRTVLGGMAQLTVRLGSDGRAQVTRAELVPLVCHYTRTTTAVYFLSDYTDDLAAQHYLNEVGERVSLDALQSAWQDVEKGTVPFSTSGLHGRSVPRAVAQVATDVEKGTVPFSTSVEGEGRGCS